MRGGDVGWEPYSGGTRAGTGRTALRVALDGSGAQEVKDPLGYLRGAFSPVAHEL